VKGLECLGKKCPHCGSENIREVRTYDRRVKKAWYCLDCSWEFTRQKVLPPLYE